ncbi:MAG: radical SAM protein [Patescibacteria group bacterium]|nr:radical SAM protein [Patescibacteria group bacterium]
MTKHLRVVVDATSACNRGCAHCGRDCNMKNVSHLSQQLIESLIFQIEKLKHSKIRLSFTGGEPLLNPSLPEIFEFCATRLGKRLKEITLVTSGFRAEEKEEFFRMERILEKLADNRLHVSLSFNLFSPHSTERLRDTLQFLLKKRRGIGLLSINLCSSRENFWNSYGILFETLNFVEIMTATPSREILVQTWNELFDIEFFSSTLWSSKRLMRLYEKSYSLPCHVFFESKRHG